MKTYWHPKQMQIAPELHPAFRPERVERHIVLLLNPFYPKDPRASFGKHVLTPTLALTSLAAATPPEWEVRYWDENLLQGPPPCEPFPQVVGITVHLTFAKRAHALAEWYRARGAIVILGGLHVQSCPDEAVRHADAIAIGNGVILWPQILRDIDRNCLQKVYRAGYENSFDAEPFPMRDLLPRRSFLTTTSLIATRGCKNRCTFCYLATSKIRMPYRCRRVRQVALEFVMDDQPYAVFTDNNLGSDPEYLRQLCQALRPLEKIWSAAVSLDVTDDPSLVREMALAGCTGVFVGFETLSNENLHETNKKNTPAPKEYSRRVDIFHQNGIQVNGSFVFGFDHDTPEVFEQTADWIERNRLECATFHILTPYPGTPLFRQFEQEGRLLHKNWELYDTAHVVFRPKLMSAETLEEGYGWCYQRLFSHRSIWRRRPQDVKAIAPYLAMSYLYKRSNWLWKFLIEHQLTALVWRPIVEWTRRRHVKFRRQLASTPKIAQEQTVIVPVSPGV
ncbi:radical SAM domain protein [Candidatus Vecturithrix granuli]|uniref:Radical SAM domain protein n=1 Tax=Vecturithrix granuli TaxID=1499967 RepID=A0A0S6WAS5_VECG1|nr:radical SAM domain protein [Candidatus Vecturithrix granuli]